MAGRFYKRIAFSLVFSLLAGFVTPPYLAAQEEQNRATEQVAEINRGVIAKIFTGLKKMVDGTIWRLNGKPGYKVDLKTAFADGSNRYFFHVQGKVPLKFKRLTRILKKKISDSQGYWLATNGPLSVDFSIKSVEPMEDGRVLVDFQLDVVVVIKEFLRELCKTGGAFLGTLTVNLCAGKIIDLLQGMDLSMLGDGLARGVDGVAGLVTGNASSEAYSAVANLKGEGFVKSLMNGINYRNVIYTLGAGIFSVGVSSGLAVVGTTIGGALGSLLAPGPGSVIGAAIGSAALVLFGNVIVNFVTRKAPLKLLMWRLRRSHKSGRTEKKAQLEDGFIEKIQLEVDRDRYEFLPLLTGYLEKERTKGYPLEAYESLIKKILDILRFTMVNDQNWHGARKYYQLLKALDRLPDTRVRD